MTRISISLPQDLLDKFDEILCNRKYQSRSNGIRDALNDYIIQYKSMHQIEGEKVGILNVIYNYRYTGIMDDLNNIQKDFYMYINGVIQAHMTDKHRLDVIIVKGEMKYIRDLTEKIMSLNGVEHVKLTSISSDEEN